MNNILSFDSIFIVNPIRKYYLSKIKKLLKQDQLTKKKLILYRLDKENIFIRDKANLSGTSIGISMANMDALSLRFYRYLEESQSCEGLKIKNQKLYQLYTRQLKLKLGGVLKCAYRIQNIQHSKDERLEIISDKQTISMIQEALSFLNYSSSKIHWKSNLALTICITLNSFVMRVAALMKMLFTPTNLPKEYFYKHANDEAPTLLITMPKRRPKDFFASYVEKLGPKFNILLFSVGFLDKAPCGYKRIKIKRKMGLLSGFFKLQYLCFDAQSYIADTLLIFKNHANLNMSIDAVNALLENNIDVHITRLQTNVLDNYLAIKAKQKGIFILGDIQEEIFYCDAVVCPSESEFTESVKLALADQSKITFRGSNSLIQYRLSNFNNNDERYLNKLLEIDHRQKIIFYASDPSKEESQRYLIEKFLFHYFANNSEFTFVLKTHTQDDGKITNYAYLDSGQPSNIFLIGDASQRTKIASKKFNIFNEFDFNSAIAASDGFLTSSSSSILQALALDTKSGIVDLFNNGFYDYLIESDAVNLINSENSLAKFLDREYLSINNSTLRFCGLKNDGEFNLGDHLKLSLEKYNYTNDRKQISTL
jgi:hypothetical protein